MGARHGAVRGLRLGARDFAAALGHPRLNRAPAPRRRTARTVRPSSLVPVLEATAKAGAPLLVIAEEVDADALATLVVSSVRGVIKTTIIAGGGDAASGPRWSLPWTPWQG